MHTPELKRASASLLTCAVLAFGSIGFTGAAIAATDGAAAASAQSSASADSAERSPHKRMHRHGHSKGGHHGHHRLRNAAMVVPGYGAVPQDVVDSLSLSAEQTELLDNAKSFIKDAHKEKRERRGDAKGNNGRVLTAPLDPHAAVKRTEERFQAMQKIHAESTAKWLALWDSLDAGQQQTLSDYLVNRSEQRAKRKAEYKEKRKSRNADNS